MSHVRLASADGKRSALVYEIAGQPGMYRVRAEKSPGNSGAASGWSGGKVLWGHDKPSEEEAILLAEEWTEAGKLPEEMT